MYRGVFFAFAALRAFKRFLAAVCPPWHSACVPVRAPCCSLQGGVVLAGLDLGPRPAAAGAFTVSLVGRFRKALHTCNGGSYG